MTTFYPVSFTHDKCGEVSRIQLFLASDGQMVGIGECSGCGADVNFNFTVSKLISSSCPEVTPTETGINLAILEPLNKLVC